MLSKGFKGVRLGIGIVCLGPKAVRCFRISQILGSDRECSSRPLSRFCSLSEASGSFSGCGLQQ